MDTNSLMRLLLERSDALVYSSKSKKLGEVAVNFVFSLEFASQRGQISHWRRHVEPLGRSGSVFAAKVVSDILSHCSILGQRFGVKLIKKKGICDFQHNIHGELQ